MTKTPMAQLKGLLTELSSLLARHGLKEVNLNKSAPKSFTPFFQGEPSGVTFENKGVCSDFIRLHNVSFGDEKTYGFGIKFSYLDESRPASVVFSLKAGKNTPVYLTGPELSLIDAKETLRTAVRALRTISPDTSATECIKQIAPLLISEFDTGLKAAISGTERPEFLKAIKAL